MKLTVRLFATLRKFAPQSAKDGEFILEVPSGLTIKELLRFCRLPEQSVTIVMVNGIVSALNTVLEDEADVSVFPPLAGG